MVHIPPIRGSQPDQPSDPQQQAVQNLINALNQFKTLISQLKADPELANEPGFQQQMKVAVSQLNSAIKDRDSKLKNIEDQIFTQTGFQSDMDANLSGNTSLSTLMDGDTNTADFKAWMEGFTEGGSGFQDLFLKSITDSVNQLTPYAPK